MISYHFKTQTWKYRPRLNPDQNISLNLAFKFNSNKIYFKDCFCCIWYSCSKQDICKASVKYKISIGDDDVWWRSQQHRSVSNEWMSKPGSWISAEYLKKSVKPTASLTSVKNYSVTINWKWHDPERLYWKTMLNYENGHYAKRKIHDKTDPRSLYSGYWLTCSQCNGTFCLPNSPQFPASNNWKNGQHSFIKNASLLRMNCFYLQPI